MSAIFSFLGGSVFRMIWGEVSAYYTKKQDQANEIERMKVQGELEAAAHGRNLESLKLQSDLGIKLIQAQAEAGAQQIELSAWAQAVADVGKSTGIKWLDTWNGSIRPLLATIATVMIVSEIIRLGFVMTDWHRELFSAILGVYVADRQLTKRGK